MAVFEGRSPSERNKLIAAILLGTLAVMALWLAFGPRFGGSSTSVSVTVSPTPRTGATPSRRDPGEVKMPSRSEQELGYMVPVTYAPGMFGAPDPGRNIFAFFEPPPPCPDCPTPLPPTPRPVIATPTPKLPFELYGVSPASVYAGSKTFRLEVSGDRYTPDAKIFFNGSELPTTFVSPQRLVANIPASLVASEGAGQIAVRTPDGSGYSLPTFLSVQAPPKPQFRYVGMIARRLGNNDTAYLDEQGKPTPTGYRLNDVVAGRFRLVNISADRVILEDVNLGFRHSVDLFRPAPGTVVPGTGTSPVTGRPGGFPAGFPQRPVNPNQTQGIPGIPNNIPRYVPPQRPGSNTNSNTQKPDEDDDEDTDNR